VTSRQGRRYDRWVSILCLVLVAGGCSGNDQQAGLIEPLEKKHLPSLLSSGGLVLGLTSGPHTREQGASIVELQEVDYVFYSLESGPFDIPALETYLQGMRERASEAALAPLPVLLRIPALRDVGYEATRNHVQLGLAAGVDGIVFPHISTAEQAAQVVELMGEASWPTNPSGTAVNVLLIEDIDGVANASAIARTPGVSMVGLGPSDLRRAYDGDMDAVERAILSVLAACVDAGVPCSTTADEGLLPIRLGQGFRVFTLGQAGLVHFARELSPDQ